MTAGPDEVRVGILVRSSDDVPAGAAWLDGGERSTLDGLRVPKRRADWLLGRWTAKRAVAAFLGVEPEDVAVHAAADGAPEATVGGAPAPCVVSITHRAGLAACGVAAAGVALGCDLELIEPRSSGFVEDYLTDSERALVEAAGSDGPSVTANLLWSAKEAVLKAARTGLRVSARDVEVRPAAADVEGWSPFEAGFAGDPRPWSGRWTRTGEHLLTVAVRIPSTDEPEVTITTLG